MLKKLFGSGARVKLLQQFLENPGEEFFIRELTRILDEQINSLRRELENLEAIGLLKSRERNRKKYYQINPHFSLLSELSSIIRKTNEENLKILKNFSKLGDLDVLILTGRFIGEEKSSLDIFLVGDVGEKDIEAILEGNFSGKNMKYAYMDRKDFLYRITLKDKFVQLLFENSENIILKNKLKKDTLSLIQKNS